MELLQTMLLFFMLVETTHTKVLAVVEQLTSATQKHDSNWVVG